MVLLLVVVVVVECSIDCGTGSTDGKIHCWNTETGSKVVVLNGEHTGPVQSVQFNPKYMMLASSCTNMVCSCFHCTLSLYFFCFTLWYAEDTAIGELTSDCIGCCLHHEYTHMQWWDQDSQCKAKIKTVAIKSPGLKTKTESKQWKYCLETSRDPRLPSLHISELMVWRLSR